MEQFSDEIRNPDSKKSFRKSRKLIGFLAAFIALVAMVIIILSYNWRGNQTIKSIEISGNHIISTQEINNIVSDSVLKMPNEKVKLSAIQKKLQSHPFVESSIIKYKGPEEITVLIKERNPVATMVLDDGSMMFVDESGRTLPYRLFENFSDLPLIRNIGNSERIDKNGLTKCLNIINEMRKPENRFLYHYLSELVFSSKYNSAELKMRTGKICVNFGKIDDIESKIEKLRIYWLNENPIAGSMVSSINLQWNDYLVVTEL